MYSLQIGKFMHFYEIGLLSSVFKEMFLMANQVHSYIEALLGVNSDKRHGLEPAT